MRDQPLQTRHCDKPTQRFILEAIDASFDCPVVAMILHVADLKRLQTLLGSDADDDDNLRGIYTLNSTELQDINEEYGVDFDPSQRECRLSRAHAIGDVPYLVHTGYELFLLLEQLKPMAVFTMDYPTRQDDPSEEALFQPHVQSGALIKRIMLDEPFRTPICGRSGRVFEGVRRVFYTLPGEEWRIDAFNLLRRQLQYGAWNDTLERLEGTLLGYSDQQNDWWIERRHYVRAEGREDLY